MTRITTARRRRLGGAAAFVLAALVPASIALARPPIGDDPPDPPEPPETTEPPIPEPPDPDPTPIPGPTTPPSGPPQPRFMVQAQRFRAENESGEDWLGSDEIFAVYEANGVLASTQVYEDVDTGDTVEIAVSEQCITPIEPVTATGSPIELSGESGDTWRCSLAGQDGVSFNVRLFEDDSNVQFWDWACFRHGNIPPINCVDDLIGEFHQTFTVEQLQFVLPQHGNYFDFHRTLSSADAEYRFTYRITRLLDFVPGGSG
jgi:hypothetical protein